ncbi:ubiquinol-cytochrome c reductase core subunit 2 [[Emmonsia] crescens]|uniref:Cytochrome b-c1 complex subunit 2, mitochondrial n=1 Tax=[Emmonsia] crescens TaxID=73230 RepID=A0A2B7ZKT5_9EURO|nr:ubiquinol-cytochrome c reductase core subunit 2 [Emmonsia crescens]
MLSRSALGRNAPRCLRKQCIAQQPSSRRGMAATAATTKGFEFESGESAGVKFANREVAGPTTTLSIVAKAGSRYQPFPGYSDLLEKFAFKSTTKRSALRITRESELLGGELAASHSRENVVLSAKFLSNDLPYYVGLLAEVISETKYSQHELDELVLSLVKYSQNGLVANPAAQALDSVHNVAFHRGLGENLVPYASAPFGKYVEAEGIAAFAEGAYSKPSIAVVASGANTANLSEWIGRYFRDIPTASSTTGPFSPKAHEPTKYYGGEERIASKAGNAIVIAFPGSSAAGTGASYKPELAVISALLGGQSTIKWSPGSSLLAKATEAFSDVSVSTNTAAYSDAGLLYVTISGKAQSVAAASKSVVETIQKVAAGNVSSEDIKKATALAKFRALEAGESSTLSLELTGSRLAHGGSIVQITEVGQSIEKVTEQQVKAAAKSLLSGKASVSTVGDLHVLPFATDIGLTV